ncbi:MAG: gamma-glutamyltransferase [Planctomycetes bacterium]|nr:gamma-glutamyltransferase [Planctomycetota bacterium]
MRTQFVCCATCIFGVIATSADSLFAQQLQPYKHAAVAADHPVASQAGLEMLKLGGNAVDAAVATSFCLSVVRPYSCGIGGGGFMVIYIPGKDGASEVAIAINYREMSPQAVGPDYYVKLNNASASRDGHHSVGVPGSVAGLLWALDNYGSMERVVVLAPAIRAAEKGFAADANHISAGQTLQRRLESSHELKKSAEYLWQQLHHNGEIKIGDTITNPDQARALKLIAAQGVHAFYQGEIANTIVQMMKQNNGPITSVDLAEYEIHVGKPLRGKFQGNEIISMPPPSSGGVAMQQIFGLVQRNFEQIKDAPHNSAPYIHLLTEAMKHAFADRAEWLADAAFVEVPIDQLLDSKYLDQLANSISMGKTNAPEFYGTNGTVIEDGGTSHLSVVDANGMAVACTETVNLTYGSLVVVPGFGFVLNDEMDDFTTVPGQPNAFGLIQSDRNLPAPGKRPLSSMSPTIVVRDGKVVLVAGASGGPRIITGTIQCLLNCLLFDMDPNQAVAEPRFHHQWLPNQLLFEAGSIDSIAREKLLLLGHVLQPAGRSVGVVQLIKVDADGLRAASDPRKGGKPAGY